MYVTVRVCAGAKKEKIQKIKPDTYEIMVKAKAQQNLANRRVQQILANEYECTEKEVKLLTGHRSAKKIFIVPDKL